MDGMLSQDEINALLAGMDNSAEGDAASDASADAASGDAASTGGGGSVIDESLLSDSEKNYLEEKSFCCAAPRLLRSKPSAEFRVSNTPNASTPRLATAHFVLYTKVSFFGSGNFGK